MPDSLRKRRAIVYYSILSLILVLLFVVTLFSIQTLLLPVLCGATLAYLFKPIVQSFQVRTKWSVIKLVLVSGLVVTSLVLTVIQVKNSIPTKKEKLELSIRLQYKMNERINDIFEDKDAYLSSWLYGEIQPVLKRINQFLVLSEEEQQKFEALYTHSDGEIKNQTLWNYYQFVKKNYYSLARSPSSKGAGSIGQKYFHLSDIYSSLSTWILMPIVFMFLLLDRGAIRKYFMSFVPNRYFELSLTLAYEVDKAIGQYLRGTFLQCSLVAISLCVAFVTVGMAWKAALLISIVAGLANAIPFLGPFIGLVIGVAYSMTIEQVEPLIPIFSKENLFWGVVFSVLLAQTLDNLYFQPFVLGNAVDLHPLIVVLGVMSGASLFGWIGMLLAVPGIVMFKVIIHTLTQQLRAYKII